MTQTPCQQRGWKIGDRFIVISADSIFSKDSILELSRDSGSSTPMFKLIEGRCEGGIPESDGCVYDFTSILFVKKLVPTNTDVPQHPNSVLQEAESIIYGDREQTYGEPDKNLRHIAEQWELFLLQKHNCDINLTPEDVCYMMADLKKCRQMNSPKRDNIVDGIGYLALTERVKK